jgi:hypothetical protein
MIYKLWNKIFGSRVHLDGVGKPFYWRYKITSVADRINNKDQVLWLTCKPEKYVKGEIGGAP